MKARRMISGRQVIKESWSNDVIVQCVGPPGEGSSLLNVNLVESVEVTFAKHFGIEAVYQNELVPRLSHRLRCR
jgi:hypothetical protein